MKLLVIGRTGQLARSLLAVARSVDMTVVAVGRPSIDLLERTTVFRAIDDFCAGCRDQRSRLYGCRQV